MSAIVYQRRAEFLLRGGLVAVLLAIVAGILGMHVLTGDHSTHTAAAAPPSGINAHVLSSATHHGAPSSSDRHSTAATGDADGWTGASCICSGDCAGQDAGHGADCTPLPKAGTLAVPEPGSSGLSVQPAGTVRFAAFAAWNHVPGSPSPGELSISRT